MRREIRSLFVFFKWTTNVLAQVLQLAESSVFKWTSHVLVLSCMVVPMVM